ncbi:12241_t:CDS:1, partial [Entrophospora sp. SA101]
MVLNKSPEELDDLQTSLIYLEQDLDVDLDNENLKVKFVNGLSLENIKYVYFRIGNNKPLNEIIERLKNIELPHPDKTPRHCRLRKKGFLRSIEFFYA